MPVAVKSSSMLLVAAWLIGCGPGVRDPSDASEWLLAGLSDRGVGSEVLDVGQWDFDPDGTVTVTNFGTAGECGNVARSTKYEWIEVDPGAVEVRDLDGGPMNAGGGGAYDRAILQINEVCQQHGVQPVDLLYFKNGEQLPAAEPGYIRGKVCLEPMGECAPDEFCHGLGCRTAWCDGEPPEPIECDW